MRRGGLTRRMVAASALLVVVVAVVFAVLLSAMDDLRGSSDWTEHSVAVLAASGELQNELGDFSSATRNYVDAPNAAALEHWRSLRAQLPPGAAGLRKLVSDNAGQAARVVALGTELANFDAKWAGPLVALAGRPAGVRRARALAQQAGGRNMMAAIRARFEAFNAREKALGLERGRNSRDHAAAAEKAAVGALAALLLGIVAFTLVLSRSVTRPVKRVAAAAARLGRGELGFRVDEHGGGELRDLAEAFNGMAGSLRDSRDELETQNQELEAQQIDLEGALEQLAQEKQQVEEFRRFIELVSRENDPDRLAETVLTELCDYVGAPVGTLYGVDGDHGAALTCLSTLGVERARLPEEILPGEGFAGRAIVERKVVAAAFGEQGLRFESFGHQVSLSQELHVPLVHGEQSVGVVTLGRSGPRSLSADELERLRYLSTQAAVGLSHAFALRRARNQAALNRAVLDTAHDAFVSFDEHGVITAWNPRAEAVFGWAAIEAVGHMVTDLIVPAADRAAHRESMERFLRGQHSELLNRRLEVTGRHRDGRDFPAEIVISPIELEGEWRFNAFIHDISERRLLEERSSKLFSISLDFMCTFTRDGRFRELNPAWSEVLGWSEAELLGSPMIDYVHPDDRERTLAQTAKLEREGEAAADFENRWRCADGSYRWLLWSEHYSPAEELVYAVAKDVTDGKRAEALLQMRLAVGNALADADTLEQGFEAVLAAAGGALGWELGAAWLPDASGQAMRCAATWTVDADPRYRSLAHSLELRPGRGLVGETWASGEPRWIADVYDELDNPAHPHAAAMRDVGVRSLASVPLMGLDGVVAVLQLLSREPREPDEHTLQTLLAIGEQVGHAVYRRLARMETDRMKDEFLALVSHELRTPLTSIVGYLELLRDEETELGSIESERFLGVIGRNAARLQRLVDDVLFAARAEAGKMGLAERAIDLASVARESVLAAHPKADEVGVELRLDSEEMLETVGDPDRLGQALDNLISNALKFTPPGGRVDVRVRTVAERVEIEVRDTGLGMAATDLERVFDRFFRSPATRDQVPGAGLGLTIVKTIVEAHGGTIAVASSEGVGTAFLIDLPLVPVGVAATWPPRRA